MRNRLIFGLFLVGPVLAARLCPKRWNTKHPVHPRKRGRRIGYPAGSVPSDVLSKRPVQRPRHPLERRSHWWVSVQRWGCSSRHKPIAAHDTECSTIVRVAIGLPAIAGGIGVGALVDSLMSRRSSPVSGLQVNWTFDSLEGERRDLQGHGLARCLLVTSAGRKHTRRTQARARTLSTIGRAFGQ